MVKTKHELVEVEWLDAQSWFGIAEEIEEMIKDFSPSLSFSTGYLLHECKEYIILGFMLFGTGMVKHAQLIPRGMIKRTRVLE